MQDKFPRLLLPAQRLVGLMDSLTGLLLLFLPLQTLRLMGISEPAGPNIFLSWVGVFVFSVGLSYFLVGGLPRDANAVAAWRMQWLITAVARCAVALFVALSVARGSLETAWLPVAATDLVVGGLQAIGLHKQLLERVLQG
ncbi:MAG: hypothetical protein O3A87_02150 [Verrucomicrobia bacterium]|nr:hypothetical protein [Verrucomicrobiota bacterium]MDA1005273.1 hypothetical protein [Verrucomicrobiota bacterium]